MKITEFSKLVSKLEGGKVNLTIAQIAEVVRCSNVLLEGSHYKAIRCLKSKSKTSKKAKK